MKTYLTEIVNFTGTWAGPRIQAESWEEAEEQARYIGRGVQVIGEFVEELRFD